MTPTDEVRRHVRLVSLVILLIVYHNSLHGTRSFLLCRSLVLPSASPWRQLLLNRDDNSSFLHMTGFTREAFNMLLEDLFDMHRHRGRRIYHRKRRGRPPLLAPEDQLGLILFLFWKYDDDEIFMHDLWYYSLGLLPCVAAHAEAHCKDPTNASMVAG